MSQQVNYDLVRAVEKITKGLERDTGLAVELLGNYGLDGNGPSSPRFGNSVIILNPKANGVEV